MDHRKLYQRADGRVWAGDCPDRAVRVAELPSADDVRWRQGVPSILDTQVLTLSPFYPTNRLGVSVESKSSQPTIRYPNHVAFDGCKAWMPLDLVVWSPTVSATPPAHTRSARPGLHR